MNDNLRRLDGGTGWNWATDYWWLRSPGDGDYGAAVVRGDGDVYYYGSGLAVINKYGVRPAFYLNLNSVLFTSAAVGGKSPGGLGTLSKVETMGTVSGAPNEWKLTLKDDGTVTGLGGHTGFNASRTGGAADPVQPGDQIQIDYQNAQTGPNEYVSAILKDSSGKILYYGNLINTTGGSASDTATLTVPSDIQAGTYTLGIFAEQCNPGTATDYASKVIEFPLTVTGVITTNLLPDGTAGTAYNQTLTTNIPGTATWSITGGTLPPGLSLDTSTGAIAGTPTAAGTYDFTVNVTGGTNTATKALSITIAPASTPTPTPTPSGGSGSNVYSIWYEVIKGHGQTWAKGSGVPLAFTAKRSAEDDKTFSLFRGVEIDGATLDQAHYTATAGSVNLSLSTVYLETLSEGTHTIRILFTDGHAEGQFTVLSAAAPANMTRVTPPQTSDANAPVLMGLGALFLLALAGMCAIVWRGRQIR